MSEKPFPLIFAFFHLYKCGGSTFNQILESNFFRAVLYAETLDHLQSGQALGRRRKRLEKQPVSNYLNVNTHFKAFSSHFASLDIASLALQPLTIVRDPFRRMVSAFSFDKVLENICRDTTFDEYAANNANRMTKTLFMGQPARSPLFYGVLEMFDESMILLEHIMYLSYGVQVDLSYAKPINQASDRRKALPSVDSSNKFKADNSDDYELYDCSVEFINSSISNIPNWDKLASDYRRRQENRIRGQEIGALNVYSSGNNPGQCILL